MGIKNRLKMQTFFIREYIASIFFGSEIQMLKDRIETKTEHNAKLFIDTMNCKNTLDIFKRKYNELLTHESQIVYDFEKNLIALNDKWIDSHKMKKRKDKEFLLTTRISYAYKRKGITTLYEDYTFNQLNQYFKEIGMTQKNQSNSLNTLFYYYVYKQK